MKKVTITITVNVPENVPLGYLAVYAKDAFESWCGQYARDDALPPGSFSEHGRRAKVKVQLVGKKQ